MTPDALARLHAGCFAQAPPPWSADAFAAAIAAPGAMLLTRPDGFLLGRVVADEAELLTLAVAPDARRRGVARSLCAEFAQQARLRGAMEAFLEVGSDNAAARALYSGCGWREVGVRRGYYADGVDALTLRLAVSGPHGAAPSGC